jgi:glycerol-3-phosphate dehydrogenase (NAD(P)+)
MTFGIIGSGSWGTALAKILTDNGQHINWWNRNDQAIAQFKARAHNPQYLTSAKFDMNQLSLSADINEVIAKSDVLLIAVPSAYIIDLFSTISKNSLSGKKIISAVKGILPDIDILLNDFLSKNFEVPISNYFSVMGPCHAEEVAAEKLSYLTFSGIDTNTTKEISAYFKTDYLKTVTNDDIYGVQYAAVLKNIYALGAGIAHGLDYGDNFLSVLIANCADEMARFIMKSGNPIVASKVHSTSHNHTASVYLGDLLVTCYSLFSRNRTFGNMIGKGYSVKSAQLEMNMVAEGYNASRCIYNINKHINANMPIAETIYNILWHKIPADEGFKMIEEILV